MSLALALLPAEGRQPNIVLILTDDQSWDSIGFLGGKVHTPRIDRLASEGMVMSDFNVTSTVCSPSRYSFLTGRYAGRCKGPEFLRLHPPGSPTRVENNCELEPGEDNLPRLLQQHGYRTGFIGKSHLVQHEWLASDSPALEKYPKDADPRNPVVNGKMQRNHQKWCREMERYGFDVADGVYGGNLKELHNENLNVHNLDWSVDRALKFIEHSREQAFFLCFSTTLHHGPSPNMKKFALGADPRMTGEGFIEGGFDVLPQREDVERRNHEAGFPDEQAFALWLDDGVGAILDKLSELGIEEDTLVIFVSDHGSWRHGKTTLYDCGMKVPMLMHWKGTIEAGSSYDGLVGNIDVAPTLLDLAGVDIPADYRMDGRSFVPVIHGERKPLRDQLFCELGYARGVKTKDWKYIAIRYPENVQQEIDKGRKFKGFRGEMMECPYLIRNGHLGHGAASKNPHYFEMDQLYNLSRDPNEEHNLWGELPEVEQRMQRYLKHSLKRFDGRPFGEFTR